jgi:predicted DNA-binding transcriptional regulator AlpA
MSSNMRLKKVCEQCGNVFVAKKTVTKTCSDECAKKLYKAKKRVAKIDVSNDNTKIVLAVSSPKIHPTKSAEIHHDLISIKVLAAATGYSRSTLFRLMAENPDFPKIQTSKRSLKFQKDSVIKYLTEKFGNL